MKEIKNAALREMIVNDKDVLLDYDGPRTKKGHIAHKFEIEDSTGKKQTVYANLHITTHARVEAKPKAVKLNKNDLLSQIWTGIQQINQRVEKLEEK